MPIITRIDKGLVPVHAWTDEIEHSAFQQLKDTSRLPIIHHHVAAMPDVHFGIIPGSMGTRSYIVRGEGDADSFCSCSHGAGRRMSRGEASRRLLFSFRL